MKKLLVLGIVALLFSCNKDVKVDYALFSGKIKNPKEQNVSILKERELIKEITINKDGTFADTLKIDTGFYSLSHGGETSAIYVSPGDNLNVDLDTEMFDETLAYSGKGSQNSNYLAAKYMADENANIDFEKLYTNEETEFLKALNDIKSSKMELLKNQKDLNNTLVSIEEKNIEYDYLSSIQNYRAAHSYYAKKENFMPSAEFMKQLEAVDYNNAEDYANVESYKMLVQGYYSEKIGKAESPSEAFEMINKNAFPALKTDLANMLSYRIAPNNDQNMEYYEGIMAMSSDEKFKESLTSKYNTVKELAKGMPSPQFVNYENHKGGTTSLEDLKGKFVYVDVWATWCGPCIVEIPSLKEVEKQYHGKNIAFVSTSIDAAKDHDKWVKMVNDKELGGIQLMADNDWKSQFVTDYAIDGIPRFLLIDPNGNIVSADAPRPSDPKLVELFKELNI